MNITSYEELIEHLAMRKAERFLEYRVNDFEIAQAEAELASHLTEFDLEGILFGVECLFPIAVAFSQSSTGE